MNLEQANQQSTIITIPFEKICTIFQIDNPTIYSSIDVNHSPDDLDFLSRIGDILTSIGMDDGASLQRDSLSKAKNIRCQHCIKETGAFLTATTYQIPNEDGTMEDRFSFIIAQVLQNQLTGGMVIQPHYILTGTINCADLVVQESLSLAEIEDETTQTMLIGHTNADEFYASLCYADAVFKIVCADLVLDDTYSQFWLTKDARPKVRERFDVISERTAQQLTTELMKAYQTAHDYNAIEMNAPSSGLYLN